MGSSVSAVPSGPRGWHAYELPLPAQGRVSLPRAEETGAAYLPESLLLRNLLWFCRLRWAVVAILAVFGFVGLFPELLPPMGLRPHPEWPFVAAAGLALANFAFLAHARVLASAPASRGAEGNLWAQIIIDLLVLTVVVHYMGSLETYVAFAYLFHIVLACIFFPRSWSLAVTATACALYVSCVVLEEAGVVPLAGVYATPSLREQMERMPGWPVLNVLWAVITWIVVWYLASHLSAMVRARDSELADTNRRLLAAQDEKTRHMLRTTHELKAPLAAVHANVHVLLQGYCGDLSHQARSVLERIAARCRRLAAQVQEMLQLGNLRAASGESLRWERLDMADMLRWCIAQVQPVADERGIALVDELGSAPVVAVEDHVKMLFSNLLSNAVLYSNRGGQVTVRCAPTAGNGTLVTIEDQGIGIPPEKLPHIFDAYYRTNEAVRHHKESTGLGLAIVRHVAETHSIGLRVESEPERGTRFTLKLPAPADAPPAEAGAEGGRRWRT